MSPQQANQRGNTDQKPAYSVRNMITRPVVIIAAAGAIIAIVLIAAFALLTGDDASADFQPVESLFHEYNSNHIHGIGYDHEDDRLLIGTHFGLFAWEDGQLYQVGEIRDDLMGFTRNPFDPKEIYVSGHPHGGGNLGVLRSLDGGLTLERIFTGVDGETVDFHSMSLSPADSNWLYGAFEGRIYRTEDGGENWVAFVPQRLASQGMCWGVPCLAGASDNPATVFAGTAEGLSRSDDGGETWQLINFEIGHTAAVVVDPNTPERVIAYTEALGVAVTPDGGDRWQSLHGNLPPVEEGGVAFQIALNTLDPDHMFIATMDMRIYETTDGGETWTAII